MVTPGPFPLSSTSTTIESLPATRTNDCFSFLIGDCLNRLRKMLRTCFHLVEGTIVAHSIARLQSRTHSSGHVRLVLDPLSYSVRLDGEA